MRHDGDGLAVIAFGPAGDGAIRAHVKLAEAFRLALAGRHHGIDLARLPLRIFMRIARGDVGVQQAFEGAIAALAQQGVYLHGQVFHVSDGLRRLPRALQIAGDDGGQRLVRQRLPQGGRLRQARRVQGDVDMALQAAVRIPGRFAMAYQ